MTEPSKRYVTCPTCKRRTDRQRMNCAHCGWSLGPKIVEKGAGTAHDAGSAGGYETY